MVGRFGMAILAMAVLIGGPAAAQDNSVKALNDRIDQLKRDLTQVQRAVYKGEAIPAPGADQTSLGPILDRLNTLEEEVRRLTGKLEEIEHKADKVNDRVDRLVRDIDFRLTALESKPAARQPAPKPAAENPAPSPQTAAPEAGDKPKTLGTLTVNEASAADRAQVVTPTEASGLPDGSPEEQYKYALDLVIRERNYPAAEKAFTAFLKAHPDGEIAGNAQYWLGETYYVQKDFARAGQAFVAGYQKFPKGPKAPDSLLKLGMTLTEMGEKEKACATLDEFKRKHPEPNPELAGVAAKYRDKAGCGK